MDIERLSEGQVFERVRRLFDGYTTQFQVIRTNGIFRARINPPNAIFESARELWYPPAKFLNRPSRFNASGQQAFYASARAHAAIVEVRPAIGDVVTLLVAGSQNEHADINCAHIGLHRCSDDPAATGANGLHPRANSAFQHDLAASGVLAKWLKLDDYFTELATKVVEPDEGQSVYKATNAIAHIMSSMPGYESLNYPSIATHLNCLNMCLTPAAVDRHFKPSEAWMFHIVDWKPELPGADQSAIGNYETEVMKRSKSIGADWRIEWEDNTGNLQPGLIGQRTWKIADNEQQSTSANGTIFRLPIDLSFNSPI